MSTPLTFTVDEDGYATVFHNPPLRRVHDGREVTIEQTGGFYLHQLMELTGVTPVPGVRYRLTIEQVLP